MVEEKIKELGYELPKEDENPFEFVNVLVHDNLAYISGTLPFINGKIATTGKVGDTVSIEEGQKMAELCILNALTNLKNKIGSLNKVKQIVKVTGFVSSATGFTEQSIVMNTATELLINIFGEKGVHARSVVGATSMPLNAPVEIELIVALEEK